jgi:hypothetical protein
MRGRSLRSASSRWHLASRAYDGALETIVVDNASSDGSAEMVRERFPDVRLICNEDNFGFAKANNIGIRQASGRYLALINSDVKVLDGCITALVAYCEADRRAGIVGPLIYGRDGKQQPSVRGFPRLWSILCRALALDAVFPRFGWFSGYLLRHKDHSALMPADILSGCFWLVRREAMQQVGLLWTGAGASGRVAGRRCSSPTPRPSTMAVQAPPTRPFASPRRCNARTVSTGSSTTRVRLRPHTSPSRSCTMPCARSGTALRRCCAAMPARHTTNWRSAAKLA